jgi:hypothetical protein
LAQLRKSQPNSEMLGLFSFQLSRPLGLVEAEVSAKLDRLLNQHEKEWKDYMGSLGNDSFLGNWIGEARS